MVVIRSEPIDGLERHGEISIAFEVTTVFELELVDSGLGGLLFDERPVAVPWIKDYDAAGGGPERWASRFDVSTWGLLGAYDEDGRRIGAAVIAFDTPNLTMLRGRRDLAVLWDLRVVPDARRSGAGSALFHASEAWARDRGCGVLEVETQQINVPACRFYAEMGCELAAVDRSAYADLADEVQLIWQRQLDPGA
jgi:GNAT superfamily N-acetyltransferase